MDKTQLALTINRQSRWQRIFHVTVLVIVTTFLVHIERQKMAVATALRGLSGQVRDSSFIFIEQHQPQQVKSRPTDPTKTNLRLIGNNQHVETNALVSIQEKQR